MTTPADSRFPEDSRPPGDPRSPESARPPVSPGTEGGYPGSEPLYPGPEPVYPGPEPVYHDPGSIPTTEVEPIPAPGTTAPPISPASTAPRMFTRISAAWLGVWAGILVVILLIVFIAQNTAGVRIRFLWLDGVIPTALALLIAGVGGAIIAMAVAAARIIQLRRLVRRGR
jgi:uncharacterized integral membrane protein